MSQRNGAHSVDLSDLVQAAQVVNNIQDDAGLKSGAPRFRSLDLPESFCFSEKAVNKGTGVPILGPV